MTRAPAQPDARRELARLRLAAQRLVAEPAASPAEAVRWMLALQAQDYPGVKWSVGLRAGEAATEAAVEAACDAGDIVRSWPLRGTLHLVAADDLHWMLELTTERSIASAAKRRAVLGITVSDIERARELAIDALPGAAALSRTALLGAISRGGVSTEGQRGYHLLWYLAQTGTLVLGPTSGSQQTFARLDAWVPNPRRLEHDEALGELAARFFRSHGPALSEDLARWSGLPLRDVRRGIAVAGARLAQRVVGGTSYWVGAEAADIGRAAATAAAPSPLRLLPGFDEYLLGYRDRSAMLAPEHAEAIVPGGNGMFRATIVIDGEVAGTWGRRVGSRAVTVQPEPFQALSPDDMEALAVAGARYGRFLGRRVDLAPPRVPVAT